MLEQLVRTLRDFRRLALRNCRLTQSQKVKEIKKHFLSERRFFSLENGAKVTEEYCWAMTQAAGPVMLWPMWIGYTGDLFTDTPTTYAVVMLPKVWHKSVYAKVGIE